MLNLWVLASVFVAILFVLPLLFVVPVLKKNPVKKDHIPALIGFVIFTSTALIASTCYAANLSDSIDYELLHATGGSTFFDRSDPEWLRSVGLCWFQGSPKASHNLAPLGIARGNSLRASANYLYAQSVYWGALSIYTRPKSPAEVDQKIRDLRGGNPEVIARAFAGLGKVYALNRQFPEAEATYKRSLAEYKRIGDRKGLSATENNCALMYHAQGKNLEAEQLLKSSLATAQPASDTSYMVPVIEQNLKAVANQR